MPCDRSAAAARRPGVDHRRSCGLPHRYRLRVAPFRRPQPVARDCAGAAPRDRQNAAPWTRPSLEIGFPRSEQQDFGKALGAFFARLDSRGENQPDAPAATLLEPDCRWNNLINAVSTYISGVELDRQSVEDFYRYDDSGINWRVVEGLGSTIAAHGADLPVMFDCAVPRIDHSGKRLRIETAKGTIEADQAIVTIPSTLLAEEKILFTPALPEKIEAASGLPLGLADKLFLSLEDAEEFEIDTRLFGRIDRAGTGAYHFRPFGRPQIEVYFGGRLASELEAAGDAAFFDFAVAELTNLLGTAFARRVSPVQIHRWGGRPVFPRVLLVRAAGSCGLSSSTRRTGRRSPVLRRRSLLPRRLFDGPWCVPNRPRRCRSGDRGSIREPPIWSCGRLMAVRRAAAISS